MLRKLVAMSLAVALTAVMFGAVGAGETTKIRIGVSPFQDTLLPIVGQDKGWYKEAGLDIEFVYLSWNAIIPAIASNSIDVAVYNTTGVTAVHNQLEDIVFLYPWNIFAEGQALMARPGKGVKTVIDFEAEGKDRKAAVFAAIQQLKGKTVISTKGTDMGKAVMDAAANNGLSVDDYTLIDMDTDQGLAAYLSGSGDFYLGGIPQRSRLETEGFVAVAVGADLVPVPLNGWITTKSFYNANTDAMLRLQNVMFRIIRYTKANVKEIGDLITTRLNQETGSEMTVDQFVKFITQIEDFTGDAKETLDKILSPNSYAYWKLLWDNDNKYYVDVDKLLTEPVPYSVFMGDEFQKAYVAKYGLTERGF